MIKKNKWKLIVTSVIILLPILVGLILWDILPERLATHWGMNGQADGWSGRSLAVFLPPVSILILHWLCVLITAADPGNNKQSQKVFGVVLWIMPTLSVLVSALVYGTALGMTLSFGTFMPILLGLMFAVLGNYLPKCKPNRTIGIKVSWTLNNAENWNATHRFCGKVWLVGGLVMMVCGFLPGEAGIIGMTAVIFLLAVIPLLYSYRYYKKQRREGLAPIKSSPMTKWILLLVAAFLVLLFFFAFTGDIQVEYDDTSLRIETNRWDDLTVEYDAINSVEYRDQMIHGSRINGFGGFSVLLGTFENAEFGAFTRYTYTDCDACIILTVGEKVLVLSGKDEVATKAIYEAILDRMEN